MVSPYERLDPTLPCSLLATLGALALHPLAPSANASAAELTETEAGVAAALSALGSLFTCAITRTLCEAELRLLVPELLSALDVPARPWLLRGELYAALAPLSSTYLELFMYLGPSLSL